MNLNIIDIIPVIDDGKQYYQVRLVTIATEEEIKHILENIKESKIIIDKF